MQCLGRINCVLDVAGGPSSSKQSSATPTKHAKLQMELDVHLEQQAAVKGRMELVQEFLDEFAGKQTRAEQAELRQRARDYRGRYQQWEKKIQLSNTMRKWCWQL